MHIRWLVLFESLFLLIFIVTPFSSVPAETTSHGHTTATQSAPFHDKAGMKDTEMRKTLRNHPRTPH